ncbi:MAG: ABC transporter ATP-binding protein [Acidimicrobiales bacterium]|nr:ABC transporter ATP-binding protein [Acidimicrobiales bacterium]
MSDEPLLEARDLVAGYLPGVDILNGASLTLLPGQLVGIIGPNGAGKSTLIKTLFGLVPVRSGSVVLRGDDITGKPAHELVAAGVGYVPQNRNVFPSLTIEENLRMGIYLQPDRFDERFESVTSLFPLLADRRGEKAGLLSGGQRQMVAMGRALMTDPSVLLLDEPSAGLSPMNQDEVFARIAEVRTHGVSVVMVEQNARKCLQIADTAFVLDQGRNAHSGTGRELLDDPTVIELYLGTLARDL